MRFDCTTAAGLRDALARTPRPMAMGRPRLLAALPEDLAGPVTKADGISSLMPLPDAPPLPPDAAADELYAKIAAAKRAR